MTGFNVNSICNIKKKQNTKTELLKRNRVFSKTNSRNVCPGSLYDKLGVKRLPYIYGNKLNELFIVIPTNLRKKLLQHLQKYGLDMLVLGGQGPTA